MGKFLIELISKGESSSHTDNVLWNKDKVYVMDNHRLALWCWFQKINKTKRYNLFHIDAHPDLNTNGVSEFRDDLFSMKLSDYRQRMQTDINLPLFRWDNYIEIFLEHYPQNIAHTISATHHLGSNKTLSEDVRVYDLLKRVNSIFFEKSYINEHPWIMNLDLDYLYSASPEKELLFSEDFLKGLASAINHGLSNGMIEVFTISLSPECCGGWEKAKRVLKYFSECELS